MTVESQETKKKYAGSSSPVADYPVTFTFNGYEDLEVIFADSDDDETILVLDTHYTVAGGDGSTGTVTVSDTDYRPSTGESLTIRLNMTIEQQLDLVDGAALSAGAIESQFDRTTRMIQQHQEELDRCVKTSATSDINPDDLLDELADDVVAAAASATAAANSASTASAAATAATAAEVAAEAARDAMPAAGTILVDDDIDAEGGVQGYDADILKADTSDVLKACFGQEGAAGSTTPTFTGSNIQTLTITEAWNLPLLTGEGCLVMNVTGAYSITPHATYQLIGDDEYDTAGDGATIVLINDGTNQVCGIMNWS